MTLYRSADECPDFATHTKHPKGYLGHYDWAQRMMKTHKQRACPTCGFLAIWTPKAQQAAIEPRAHCPTCDLLEEKLNG